MAITITGFDGAFKVGYGVNSRTEFYPDLVLGNSEIEAAQYAMETGNLLRSCHRGRQLIGIWGTTKWVCKKGGF